MATWNIYDIIDSITIGTHEDLLTHLRSGKYDLNKSDGSHRTPLDYCTIGTAVNYSPYKDEGEIMTTIHAYKSIFTDKCNIIILSFYHLQK